MMWWLAIHTPAEVHAYPIGDPEIVDTDSLIQAARHLHNFPPGNGWMSDNLDELRWSVQLAPGDPHPSLSPILHTLTELEAVSAADVQAYRRATAEANRKAHLDSVAALLEALHPDDRAQLLADMGGRR